MALFPGMHWHNVNSNTTRIILLFTKKINGSDPCNSAQCLLVPHMAVFPLPSSVTLDVATTLPTEFLRKIDLQGTNGTQF